jgi:hypothetical protein
VSVAPAVAHAQRVSSPPKGLIDEVRIYDRALSPAELVADRDRPVGP